MERRVHLVGIGGAGMSALALVLAGRGWRVTGSDRDFDRGRGADLAAALAAAGVMLAPQDGSLGGGPVPEAVVVSGAVEESIADVAAARAAGLPVRHRAELLAEIVHSGPSLAVAGTSGKSTVAGMAAWILRAAGLSPTFVGGAPLAAAGGAPSPGTAPGPAAWVGGSGLVVAETDESDGSLALYSPDVAVITNLSEDHRPLPELRGLFAAFALRAARAVVVNADRGEPPPETAPGVARIRFGLSARAEVRGEGVDLDAWGVRFRVGGIPFRLGQPGLFNVENALAAVAAARAFGVADAASAAALRDFPGIHRRMERVGAARGVEVIDDFAHNPDKVAAALAALRGGEGRLRVVFQLHGYGPARMHRRGLVEAFAAGLGPRDRLWLPPIYYAGGSVTRDIEAADYAADLRRLGVEAEPAARDPELPGRIAAACAPGDRAVVMGARDPSLPGLARAILDALRGAAAATPSVAR